MASACERFGHAWYVGAAGGLGCGRCGERRSRFCVVNGKPDPNHEHALIQNGADR